MLALLVALIFNFRSVNRDRAACVAAGGDFHATYGDRGTYTGSLCLNPSAVIHPKGAR